MKNRKIIWLVVLLVISVIIVIGILVVINKNGRNDVNKDKIPDGYIAVFHGGVGERTHQTYIYKINNGQANYGFNYINVTSTTIFYGSPQWNNQITERGLVEWTDNVFEIAKKNGADSFVTLPNSDKIYTIEEYRQIFLMN